MQQETITIQGKYVPYNKMSVPVDQIDLDPANPRVQFLVGQVKHIGQNELDEMIWSKDSVRALSESIKQNGGVHEPIFVVEQLDSDRLLVREGNCRTVISRHLNSQGIPNFSTIPAMVFKPGALTEEDLAVYLADIHVTGKIKWDAYEKAKQVYDLLKKYGKPYDWMASHLQLSKSKIKELVDAYTGTSEFLAANPHPDNIQKFSFFHEVMKKKELREKFQTESTFKASFNQWLVNNRLTDAKQVRQLPEILANTEATKALSSSGFPDAIQVVLKNDPALESEAFWAVKNATEYLHKLPASDIQDLKTGSPKKVIMLKNLYRALDDVATLSGVRLG
jgi:hypothetical protein